ncbi:MAG: F0F1 ATP synthase subunit A [Bacteroidota bacterium]
MKHRITKVTGIAAMAVLLWLAPLNLMASGGGEKTDSAGAKEKIFEPGSFIIHHISDAYVWHILEVGELDIAIPLPIILYSESGLDIFMFNQFEAEEGAEGPHAVKRYKDYIYSNYKITAADGRALYDFSITKNVLSLFISIILILVIFLSVARSYRKREGHSPKGIQSIMEVLILFVRDEVVYPSLGKKRGDRFLPYLLTLFFFIFINNLLGLVPIFPGGANLTGNIAITMTLALMTFFITLFSTNKGYWVHVVNTPGVPWWLKFPLPLMPIVEIIGIFTKPFVLMVRLFANISAGHIIALGFVSLIFIFGTLGNEINAVMGVAVSPVSILFMVFMTVLELLVAFLQAYVFTLLSALYFGMAKVEEHH